MWLGPQLSSAQFHRKQNFGLTLQASFNNYLLAPKVILATPFPKKFHLFNSFCNLNFLKNFSNKLHLHNRIHLPTATSSTSPEYWTRLSYHYAKSLFITSVHLQWNPVNLVSKGPQKSGCIYGVVVLKGSLRKWLTDLFFWPE